MIEVIGLWIWGFGVLVAFDYVVNNRYKGQVLDYHIVNVFSALSWLGIAMILTYDMVKRLVKKIKQI